MKRLSGGYRFILFTSVFIIAMMVQPIANRTYSEGHNEFYLSVEATLEHGEITMLTVYEGPEELERSITADFNCGKQFALSGSKYDYDQETGASGSFYVSVKGWYESGKTYFWKEEHYSTFTLNWGHSASRVYTRSWSDEYDNEFDSTVHGYWWYDCDQHASTRMEVDVLYLGWPVGTVTVQAMVNPPD